VLCSSRNSFCSCFLLTFNISRFLYPNIIFVSFRTFLYLVYYENLWEWISFDESYKWFIRPQKTMYAFLSKYDNLCLYTLCIIPKLLHNHPSLTFIFILENQVLQNLPWQCHNSGHPSCFLYKTQHFGDWILSMSSGGTYYLWPNR
jgi:hypothetical protein